MRGAETISFVDPAFPKILVSSSRRFQQYCNRRAGGREIASGLRFCPSMLLWLEVLFVDVALARKRGTSKSRFPTETIQNHYFYRSRPEPGRVPRTRAAWQHPSLRSPATELASAGFTKQLQLNICYTLAPPQIHEQSTKYSLY